MEKNEFKQFCHDEFTKWGVVKYKSIYFKNSSHGLLCGLSLQASYGGLAYYINCDFFIGSFPDRRSYPSSRYSFDLTSRPISVLSKNTVRGKTFMSSLIEYSRYSVDELQPYFSAAFQERINPPLQNGKQELIDNISDWLPLTKDREEIMRKIAE